HVAAADTVGTAAARQQEGTKKCGSYRPVGGGRRPRRPPLPTRQARVYCCPWGGTIRRLEYSPHIPGGRCPRWVEHSFSTRSPKRNTLAPLALALLVVGQARTEDAKGKGGRDAAKLVGDWKITTGLRGGDKIGEMGMKMPIKVTKDTFILGTGDQKFVIGYK